MTFSVNLKHAQYVLAVLRTGSMTEAAKQLYISQPSLSQTIRQAEEQLGTPIFNRDTAPLSLTYAGQMYVKAAREVMSIDTNLLNEIEEIKSKPPAKPVVCTPPSRRADWQHLKMR